MPELTASQQTALRNAPANMEVRVLFFAGEVFVDRAATTTANDKVAAAYEAASKGDVQHPFDVAQAAQEAAQITLEAAHITQEAAQPVHKAAQSVLESPPGQAELPLVQPELRKTCCKLGVPSRAGL